MAYGTRYILEFQNQIGEDYSILFNRKDYTGNATELIGLADALHISSLNNDDDPFAPILSRECEISIHVPVEQDLSIFDFLSIEDDDWNIIVYRERSQPPIFDGFMLVEDSSQGFYDRPYNLRIRASDGLPLLKDVPLKTVAGGNFEGLNSVVDYITNALYYIKPEINSRFYYNIRHAAMGTDSPLAEVQLHAKSFKKDGITFQDSYTVIESILKSFACRLFYENGYWHIVSILQHTKDYGFNYVEYDAVGRVAIKQNDVMLCGIGKNEIIYPVNKDAVQYCKVAAKSVTYTFNYDIPSDIIDNQSFKNGIRLPALGTTQYDAYSLPGWVHQINRVLPGPPNPVKTAYVRKEIDAFFFEKDMYAVLPNETSGAFSTHLLSSLIPVDKGDYFSITLETKAKNDYSSSDPSVQAFYVILRGDGGTMYAAGYGAPATGANVTPDDWVVIPTDLSAFGGRVVAESNKTTWKKASFEPVEERRVPVDGTIQIILVCYSRGSDNETHFKNIQITYSPYINSSFRPVKGDVNLYEQNRKINKAISETVVISDSPKRLIKGGIFIDGELASPSWSREGFYESMRFTQLMALIKYTFNYSQFHKIEGTMKGLSYVNANAENVPFGFLLQYTLTDLLTEPNNRYILASMDVNYVTGQWRAVLVQLRTDNNAPFDRYDFSYIFE